MKSKKSNELPKCVGVIHLPALPGAPGSSDIPPDVAMGRAGLQAVKEAQIYAKAGFDGMILENFGDQPFFRTSVPPETIAAMAVIAAAVREVFPGKIGINVLRNDANSALAIAAVTGCDFIRVNVLSGVAATDQGWIEGNAAELIRRKIQIGAHHIAILADVQVKHAEMISTRDLALSIEETALRAGADGIIITGPTTGRFPDRSEIERALRSAQHCDVPIYIGSGMSVNGFDSLHASGLRFIVGSSLRRSGRAGNPLDPKRCKTFVARWKKYAKTRRAAS